MKGKTIEWPEQVPWIPLQCLGRASLQGMVKSDGDIQSELAVFLPSAQTFINITSQPTGKPTSNLKRKKEDHIRPDWHDVRLTISCASYFPEHYWRNRNVSCQQKKNNILFTWGTCNSSQEVNRVKSDVVLCSFERSSSSRCPGFAQAVAWMADDQIPVWTTQVHLGQKINN